MTLKEIYELQGLERLEAIQNMTIDQRDEVCEQFTDCHLCPFALIYSSRPYCAEVSFAHRIRILMTKGGKFRTLEEVRKVVDHHGGSDV